MMHPFSYHPEDVENAQPAYVLSKEADVVYATAGELKAHAVVCEAAGQLVAPSDRIDRGEIGYFIYDPAQSEQGATLHVWRPFGKVSVEVLLLLEWSDAASRIIPYLEASRVFRCDRAYQGKVGFVHFDVPGHSKFFEMPMKVFKATFYRPDVYDWLGTLVLAWRAELPSFRSLAV